MYICRKPSEYPAATRFFQESGSMSVFHKPEASSVSCAVRSANIFIPLILIFFFAACSSTIVDSSSPTDPTANGDDLVITLSAPNTYAYPGTRADADPHAGHQLRYVAKLYKADNTYGTNIASDDANCIKRVEQLAKDGNTIIFTGVSPTRYFVVIFADYIDATAVIDPQTGHYPDKYYKTTNKLEGKNNEDAGVITYLAKNEDFFNNHNLDCFKFKTVRFEKEDGKKKEFDVILERCVSQVQVVNTANNYEALKDITITQYGNTDEYAIANGLANYKDPVSSNFIIDIADPDQNILFFFYTFNMNGKTDNGAMKPIKFTLNPKDDYVFATSSWETPEYTIGLAANTIYKVQGAFLSLSGWPSNIANLMVLTDKNWNNSSQTVN